MKRVFGLIMLVVSNAFLLGANEVFAQQDHPLMVKHYDLNFSFDFTKNSMNGICRVTVENVSDADVDSIPFLLYRLMKVASVKDSQGKDLSFEQKVVSFPYPEQMQVNAITVNERVASHSTISLDIKYSGYLFGYQETGASYLKDRITPEYTMLRTDAFAFPILSVVDMSYLRDQVSSNKFTYAIRTTVPTSLMVASGGQLVSKTTEAGNTTYIYDNKQPNWRIDVAVSSYDNKLSDRLNLFYFESDSVAANAMLEQSDKCFKQYEQWWGALKSNDILTLIETEAKSGGQASDGVILLPQDAFNEDNYDQMYHELSHMWNVTIKEEQGAYPRWNEGLGSFFQYYMVEYFHPEKEGFFDNRVNNALAWLKKYYDSEPEMYTMPMCEYGNRNKTDNSYSQGMAMFAVLHKWLGADTFNSVIRSFYQKYGSSSASTRDFTDMWISMAQNRGLEKFFNDWVYTANYTAFIKNGNTIDEIVKHYSQR